MYILKLKYYDKWTIDPYKHLALLTLYKDNKPIVCSWHICSSVYIDSIIDFGRSLENRGVKFIIDCVRHRWKPSTKWEYIRRAKSLNVNLHTGSKNTKEAILGSLSAEQIDLFSTPSEARV